MSRAVIDQPGVRISAFGLVLALFFGLAIRNQISDNRVNAFLGKATQRLNSEFQIDFDSAKVNLSKWGLPFPVLEIKNIRVSPRITNCKNSQIFIDELEVPISLRLILGLSDRIPKIRMKNFEIRLDAEDRCFSSNSRNNSARQFASVEDAQESLPKKLVENALSQSKNEVENSDGKKVSNLFESRTRAELREIYVEKIKFISSAKPDQPLVLKQVNFDLSYDGNKLSNVSIRSRINAIKDARSDLFYINADYTFIIKPLKDGVVDAVMIIEGNFLDGEVRLFGHYASNNPKISYEAVINKVSTKALFPIISPEFQRSSSAIQKVPMSVSFQNTGEVSLGSAQHIESTFSRILFNIENATVRANEIKLDFHDGKLKIWPFDVLIDSLPLSRFKNTDLFTGRLDSFENLGVLSGILSFKDEKDVKFDGLLRNLEVVFSNRGRRDFQMIDEINFNLKRSGDALSLNAHSLVVNQKKINGNMTATHDLKKAETNVNLRLAGVFLNKRVWEQFTYVEQDPKLDVTWYYKRNLTESHDLKLHADNIEFPGVLLSNLNFEVKQFVAIDPLNSSLVVQIKPSKLLTNQKLFDNSLVSQAVDSSLGLKNQNFTSDKTSISINGKSWQNLEFNLDSYLVETQTKMPVRLNIKGSSNQKDGFNSRLLIGLKNRDYRFNFTTLENNELSLNADEK